MRYAPDKLFPTYTHTPGVTPHPVKSPKGHSYRQRNARMPPLEPSNWQDSPTYLYAVDLFNHGYYWEAHESWEGLWHAAKRRGITADFLKGLIKLAAAGVKVRQANQSGAQTHCRRARGLFHKVQESVHSDKYAGADLEDLMEFARTYRNRIRGTRISSAYAPQSVFTWQIVLR